MEPKSSKNASGVTGASKCGPKVAPGGERDAKVLQKVPKWCQKHVLEHPGRYLLGTLGSKRAPSQNIGIYCVKPTFAPPGELLQDIRANHSDLPGALIAKVGTKVMQKVPGGRHRSARGGHLSAQGAKRCPKR
jgi:hypothetical protein